MPKWLYSPWATVGAVLLVLAALVGSIFAMRAVRPGAPAGASAGDLEEYAAGLRARVPCEAKAFADAGFVAEEYRRDPTYPQFFYQLTIRVDPVTLTDRITGRTERYTRARLTLNNPGAGGRFGWEKVEMLP